HRKEVPDFCFVIPAGTKQTSLTVIEALEGQLITNRVQHTLEAFGGNLMGDVNSDLLKIAVVNRYNEAPVALGFIKNFGLKQGAIASSVAHDSHNIVAVGVDDESICRAVNLVIDQKGGISCVASPDAADRSTGIVLPLPVAGLMSAENGYKVASEYTRIDAMAKSLGSTLQAPFMTLSFMALLVIPHLKLSDKGLFDGDTFKLLLPENYENA
ncbi:MAG: adenine deaminase C-terminal domain-containing protein, partial [Chitinophagaceae bacterium]